MQISFHKERTFQAQLLPGVTARIWPSLTCLDLIHLSCQSSSIDTGGITPDLQLAKAELGPWPALLVAFSIPCPGDSGAVQAPKLLLFCD